MAGGKQKLPMWTSPPKGGKVPRYSADPEGFMQLRPAWRIHRLEMVGRWGWHELPAAKLFEIHGKLSNLESMTWQQLLVEGKERYHLVAVSNLASCARKRLEELGQSDLDELLSLRLSARERIWGIQNAAVVNLLWWDPEHEICPSLKKHT